MTESTSTHPNLSLCDSHGFPCLGLHFLQYTSLSQKVCVCHHFLLKRAVWLMQYTQYLSLSQVSHNILPPRRPLNLSQSSTTISKFQPTFPSTPWGQCVWDTHSCHRRQIRFLNSHKGLHCTAYSSQNIFTHYLI